MPAVLACHNPELSYVCGSCSAPLVWRTCLDDLRDAAKMCPDKVFVKFRDNQLDNQDLTYGHLDRQSDFLAICLHKIGLKRGDRVGCLMTNCAEAVLTELALYKVGCVVVRAQISLSARNELAHVLKTADCVALLYHRVTMSNAVCSLFPNLLPVHELPKLRLLWGVGADDEHCLESLVANLQSDLTNEQRSWLQQSIADLQPSDIMCACMTSGSTGFPKIVPITHFAMTNNVRYFGESMRVDESSVTFSDRSFSHVSGPLVLYATLSRKATMVYMRRTGATFSDNNADYILQVLSNEGCTTGMFFAYLLHDIIHKCSERDRHKIRATFKLDKLRHGVIGGQVSSASTIECGQIIVPGLRNVYGSSEVLIISHHPRDSTADDTGCHAGQVAPYSELSIRDPAGRLVRRGESGELWIRGYNVTLGYLGDPAATRKSLTLDGWFKTGDVGYLDCQGSLTLYGRHNDLIIRATHNFYPVQFEQIIQQHSGVERVSIVGVADERLGEEICACVVPKAGQEVTEAALLQLFHSASVGLELVVPKYFLFFNELPTNNTGKTDRRSLKQIVLEKLFC